MHDLILLFASVIPEDKIIEDLQEALTAHKLAPSDDTKNKLSMWCTLFLSKGITDKKDVLECVKEIRELEQIKTRMHDQAKS